MKKRIRLISLALLLITMICMFLPIARFEDHSADSLSEDIAKQEDKLQRAKDKYDRYVSGGKDADTLAKQQKQVDKEQSKLDELLAQQSGAAGDKIDALTYSLLPGKLPSVLELDQQVINNYKLYDAGFGNYYMFIWAAFILLALTFALELAAGNKYASRLYTFASFTNLAAILLLCYTFLRIGGFPFGNDQRREYIVYAWKRQLHIRGLVEGDQIRVYSLTGQLILSTTARDPEFTAELPQAGGVYAVRVNDFSTKVRNL